MSAAARAACFLLLAIFALPPAPQAAEAAPVEAPPASGQPDAAPAEDRSQDDAPAEATAVGQQAGAEVPASEDVFVPTVEVSEDTSVPFPVDI